VSAPNRFRAQFAGTNYVARLGRKGCLPSPGTVGGLAENVTGGPGPPGHAPKVIVRCCCFSGKAPFRRWKPKAGPVVIGVPEALRFWRRFPRSPPAPGWVAVCSRKSGTEVGVRPVGSR